MKTTQVFQPLFFRDELVVGRTADCDSTAENHIIKASNQWEQTSRRPAGSQNSEQETVLT